MDNFRSFSKIPRFQRDVVVTEKIDGTNAQIFIEPFDARTHKYIDGQFLINDLVIHIGSRNRWLSHHSDNFGFWNWCADNIDELAKLGPGRHFGEWWGLGIQRGYDLNEKRFSLFNVHQWNESTLPECCLVVPTIAICLPCDTHYYMGLLRRTGSQAAPGFMNPEGIIIYHTAAGRYFKETLEKDDEPKSRNS